MKKGITPLLATVILIALTLTVAALLGSWFASLTSTQTNIIEEDITTQINCSSAVLEITDITCSGNNDSIKIMITNLGHDIPLYNFSTVVFVNNTYYLNSTGGPNSTNPLNPGEQAILSYRCENTTYCVNGKKVSKVIVSPSNCPQARAEKTFSDETC